MSVFETLFGSATLTGKSGDVKTSSLDGTSVVAIYFSAHWCPPCRGFTPRLATWYKDAKKAGINLEVVFASSDRDQESFDEYFQSMPWLALPFDKRAEKDALSKKYQVRGIPTLVLVNGQGELITKDGRAVVVEDPECKEFPWTPPTLQEMVGDELVKGGKTISTDTLAGKTLAFYFSAHWCPPCRGFTPKLSAVYEKLQAAGKPFEIVYVSGDKSLEQFNEYHGTMPFAALPYSNTKGRKNLNKHFEVEGIPTLVILESLESGKVLNKSARGAVTNDPEGAEFPWLPKKLNNIEADTEGINDFMSVFAALSGASEEVSKASLAALEKVANGENATLNRRFFFSTDKNGDMTRRLLQFVKGPATPALVLFDVPEMQFAVVPITETLTEAGIKATLADYDAGKIKATPLQ